jgi:phosphatidylinositol alpha-1,6-mannosyltransferase
VKDVRRGILLVSEVFPPAVGGSAELFGNVYSRVTSVPTSVLTDEGTGARQSDQTFQEVYERRLRTRNWGILHPRGLSYHLRVASDIWRAARKGTAVVHCGRALPEGFSALVAQAAGAPPYVCWAHGEELGYIDSSRELRQLASIVFGRARAVLANSENTADLLKRRGVPAPAIHVVRPGVNAEWFHPGAAGAAELRRKFAPGGETICLTVGRLQRRKGHDLVLDALAHLGPMARRLRYVIAGDGEERPRLESIVRERGLEPVVTFVGRVGTEELPRYYAAADLFVHPNRVDGADFEGFGIVFLEAAACGLPVIAGRSGGVPEAVAEGVTGMLVSGTDIGELQQAMTVLIESPEKRREMGAAARSRVLAEFTWQRAADELSAVHAQVINQ